MLSSDLLLTVCLAYVAALFASMRQRARLHPDRYAPPRLPRHGSVRALDEGGRRLAVECAAAADPREDIFRAAVENGWTLLELAETQASLEDIFVRLTTRDRAAEALAEEPAAAPEEVS